MKRIFAAALALALSTGLALGQVQGQFAGGTLYGNNGTSQALGFPTSSPVLGRIGTTGQLGFRGATSGTVTIKPAAAAGTWSFTWPTTAGTVGQAMVTDGAGVSTTSNLTFDTISPAYYSPRHLVVHQAVLQYAVMLAPEFEFEIRYLPGSGDEQEKTTSTQFVQDLEVALPFALGKHTTVSPEVWLTRTPSYSRNTYNIAVKHRF